MSHSLHGRVLSQAHPVAHWVCFADLGPSRIVPTLCAARNLAVIRPGPNWPGSSHCCSGQHPWQPICPSMNHKSFHWRYLGIGVSAAAPRKCCSALNQAPELGLFRTIASEPPLRSRSRPRSSQRQLGLFRTLRPRLPSESRLPAAHPKFQVGSVKLEV